ncbi:MAG: restriction endonuclease [Candidatus Babeliaceae bacterium]|nr:restriction endonuclease [Candidatus Babeliaceae bacterium]
MNERQLYYGDNLKILREYIADESVDLVYLDPPFNSNRNYNVLFKDESGQESESQLTAFEDTWHWDMAAESTYHSLLTDTTPEISTMMSALREFIGTNQMMAYLVMMTARLIELHRVLTSTGSLYLHCDPTASHYLKIVLDAIFGVDNFRNEIIWKRTSAHSSAKKYGDVHDVILFYAMSNTSCWNKVYQAYEPEYLDMFLDCVDEHGRRYKRMDLTGAGTTNGPSGDPWRGLDVRAKGRHWAYSPDVLEQFDRQGKIHWPKKAGGMPRLKQYREDLPGVLLQDVWNDIKPMHNLSAERLGYPTQKPVALLERILETSSNDGDLVLDPFCGCGTTIHAAQKLNRKWIGIDITHLAIALQKYRLKNAFELIEKTDYDVIGEPESFSSAKQLALDDRYQFQWWALSLIQAQPIGGETGSKKGKKGKDQGIDGMITFLDDPRAKPKRLIVQVKSGKVKSGDIRDLVGTLEREKAAIGVFITLERPSKDMKSEAASAGFYHSPNWRKDYPRIQILTIEELLAGREVQMPPTARTYKKAQREHQHPGKQQQLL